MFGIVLVDSSDGGWAAWITVDGTGTIAEIAAWWLARALLCLASFKLVARSFIDGPRPGKSGGFQWISMERLARTLPHQR